MFGIGGSPASRLAAANYSQVAEEMIRQNLCTSGELRSTLELLADPEFGVATHLLISAGNAHRAKPLGAREPALTFHRAEPLLDRSRHGHLVGVGYRPA